MAILRIEIFFGERTGAGIALFGQPGRVAVESHARVERDLTREGDHVIDEP
jgi:hypothetical protein